MQPTGRQIRSPLWRRIPVLTLASVLMLAPAVATQAAAFLYAADEIDNSIRLLQTATGVEISARTLAVTGVTGTNRFDSLLAAAIRPADGLMYAYLDLKDKNTKVVTRKFVSINPRSGAATDVAVIDLNVQDIPVTGMAFAADGTLYASDGSDLYSVGLGDGFLTAVMALSAADSDSIAFNPVDGRLYRAAFTAGVPGKVFESIDLNNLTVSNIPLTGATAPGLITLGLTWDAAQGLFLGFRNDGSQGAGEYFSVTSSGVETLIAAMPISERSFAFLDTDALPAVAGFGKRVSHIYAGDRDGPYISQLDADSGAEIDLIGVTLAGATLQGVSGLAVSPLDGQLFATVVVLGERSNHRLVRLDPLTGQATLVGLTGHIIAGLSFDAAGTLYAVSADDDGFTPSWLFSINTDNAFVSLLFDFGTANTPDDGEIIAYDSGSGLLYHASGGIAPSLETIDLTTGNFDRAPVGLSGGFAFQISALGYDPRSDRFLGANADGGVIAVTPGGAVSNIQAARPISLKGLGVITPAAAGDLGGDRKADILWRNTTSGQNWAYGMNGATIASSTGINTVDPVWQIAGRGDYNGDGRHDILWRNSVTGQNWMYLMNGTAIIASMGVNTVADSNWQVAGSGDYNSDGKADILWRNAVTGQNWMYLMDGAGISSSAGVNTVSDLNWTVASSEDFNGDGYADILWRNTSTGQNWMYLMNGTAIASSVGVNTVPTVWTMAGDGDHNGDGKADILWRNSITGQNWLYLMNGAAIASSTGINTLADTQWFVAADDDFDGDGMADILWRHSATGQNWMYLMNGATISSSSGVNTVPGLWEIVSAD